MSFGAEGPCQTEDEEKEEGPGAMAKTREGGEETEGKEKGERDGGRRKEEERGGQGGDGGTRC